MSEQSKIDAERAVEAFVAELTKLGKCVISIDDLNALIADRAALQKARSLPAAGSAVEEVEVVGYRFFHVDHGYIFRRTHIYEGNPSLEAHSLMTVAQHERIVAALSAQQSARQPELTVWEGSMPESNGKSNFTAVLMRKGADLFDGVAGGMTIASSEYPDRVRYEADCVRWLIGELDKEPCITDYYADKHSGYVDQQSAPERVSVPMELLQDLHDLASDAVDHHRAAFAGYKLKRQANMEHVVEKARAILASHQRGEANG